MDQLSFDFNDSENSEQNVNRLANAKEAFGCCHRYRECSDVGICIIQDNPDALNCVYRLNLAKGNVFFGKNANDFDLDFYRNIKQKYLSLPQDLRIEIDCLILYYCKHRSPALWYNSERLVKLKELGFLEYDIAPKMILNLYQHNYLGKFIDDDVKKKLNKEERERLKQNNVRAKKPAYVKWLIENPNSKLDKLLQKFAFVTIPPQISRYIFELYYDYLSGREIYNEYKNLVISHLPKKMKRIS